MRKTQWARGIYGGAASSHVLGSLLLAPWWPGKNALEKEIWLQWRSDCRNWRLLWEQRRIILQKRHRKVRETLEWIYRMGHLTFGIWIGYKKKLIDMFSKLWFYYKDWTFLFKNETQHLLNDYHGWSYSTPFDQPNSSVNFRLFGLQSHERRIRFRVSRPQSSLDG